MKLSKKNYDGISAEDRIVLTRWQEIWQAHIVCDGSGLLSAIQKLADRDKNVEVRVKTINKLVYNSRNEASEILARLNEGLKR